MKYRADIDGLRAVAVLPVVFFHLGISPFSGGYVGVDVFFVISGFLITSIIYESVLLGKFSLLEFYDRRFRRIIPASAIVIFFCFALGWLILTPQHYEDLGRSAIAAVLFISNIYFWYKIDYFGPGADAMPLLHTWSLSVEEQFYLIFPIFLFLIVRARPRATSSVILFLLVASLSISIFGVNQRWSAAYYWAPFRFWELMAGSFLAVARPKVPYRKICREIIAILAGLGILIPCFALNDSSPFPGLNAISPVLGASLLIWIGSADRLTCVGRVLASRPLVAIGLISYSLYLWHWPIIVFSNHMMLERKPILYLGQLTLMISMAWLSWRYIEAPFRDRDRISRRSIFLFSGATSLMSLLFGALLVQQGGVLWRFPEIAAIEDEILAERRRKQEYAHCIEGSNGVPWAGVESCFITKGSGQKVLLWGDSHALHYHLPLNLLDDQIDLNILAYGMTGCVPIFGVEAPNRSTCIEHKEHVVDLIKDNSIERVIVSGLWNRSSKEIFSDGPHSVRSTVRRLRDLGVEVNLIGDSPIYRIDSPAGLLPKVLASPDPTGVFLLKPSNNPAINAALETIVGSENFFNPMDILCEDEGCAYYDDGKPLLNDRDHLSLEAARRVLTGFPSLVGYAPP